MAHRGRRCSEREIQDHDFMRILGTMQAWGASFITRGSYGPISALDPNRTVATGGASRKLPSFAITLMAPKLRWLCTQPDKL